MTAYYNENDPGAAAWLRELIASGLIAPGVVDDRSIVDVRPADLAGFKQCHFFAGIGVWSYALRCTGWPDGRPVWSGSCPCQPLSSAGQRKGHADVRHLWPAFHGLVAECRPPVVFGEQVASKDGREWFAAVRADLEATRYACGAADLCAAGIGAPHIRQRLYWVAHAYDARLEGRDSGALGRECPTAERGDASRGLADADGGHAGAEGLQRGREQRQQPEDGGVGGVGNAIGGHEQAISALSEGSGAIAGGNRDRTCPTNGLWRDADWLLCRDGKWRPVEPGTFPLAHGAPARVGRLRGYGNAIVAPLAQAFIEAVKEEMAA